ncbi:MAG TPA: cation-translocating P-type ATPase [Longimicrobiales bacterium]|nr:cation-translocating P-type ATPase [Longimicrobiales bacterium]
MTDRARTSHPAVPGGRAPYTDTGAVDGPPPESLRELRFRVGEMDCPSCLSKIEAHLSSITGIRSVHGSVLSRTLSVSVDEGYLQEAEVRAEVRSLGYTAEPLDAEAGSETAAGTWVTAQARRAYAALAVAGLGGILRLASADPDLFVLPHYAVRGSDLALVLAAGVAGWSFFPKGFAAARRFALDMNFLMSVAIVGAVLLGEFVEAAAIAVLFSIAELLEAYSVDRARASIQSLMEMAPEWAVVVRGRVETTVPASSLVVGDEIVVRPGDRVAADGTVLEGTSAVDQSAITGESLPIEKAPGDGVFSGTINRAGHLRVRVDRPAGESALATIVRLVEEAEASKTESERFVDTFARYYTPTIAVAALVTAVVPPLLFGAPAALWITRGLTLLVIACPCALVISTPVAVVSGLTAAARHGVLIKGGSCLEAMASVRVFALDKTGTLTVGHPVVRSVTTESDESDVLTRAAAIERLSEHPLARAIVEEADRRGLDHSRFRLTGFEAIPGKGARATIDGEEHVVGRPDLFPGVGLPPGLQARGESVVGISQGGSWLAWISLADHPRAEAAAAMEELRGLGIERTIMLTGDNVGTAEAIASAVGVDALRAELLPSDKLSFLRELEQAHGPVAMVGDGVNDAPALAAATVGIAMGAVGSDTAIETADIALMGDDLTRLPYLLRLSRRARAVIKQNIVAAIAVKALLAIAVPFGYVSLITAVLVGDMGVSLAVTANALRLARVAPSSK